MDEWHHWRLCTDCPHAYRYFTSYSSSPITEYYIYLYIAKRWVHRFSSFQLPPWLRAQMPKNRSILYTGCSWMAQLWIFTPSVVPPTACTSNALIAFFTFLFGCRHARNKRTKVQSLRRFFFSPRWYRSNFCGHGIRLRWSMIVECLLVVSELVDFLLFKISRERLYYVVWPKIWCPSKQ